MQARSPFKPRRIFLVIVTVLIALLNSGIVSVHNADYGGIEIAPLGSDYIPATNWSADIVLSNASLSEEAGYDADYSNPFIAVEGSNIHVIWRGYSSEVGHTHITYRSSIDGGLNWGNPKILSTPIEEPFGTTSMPNIGVNGNSVHAAWLQNPGGEFNVNKSKIMYSRSLDNGAIWSAPIPLRDEPTICLGGPLMSVGGDNIVVFWGECYDVWYIRPQIHYKVSTDNGNTWSSKKVMTNDLDAEYDLSSIWQNGNEIFALYLKNWPWHELYFKRSFDFGETLDNGLGIDEDRIIVYETDGLIDGGQTLTGKDDNLYVVYAKEIPNFELDQYGYPVYTPYYQLKFIKSENKGETWTESIVLVDHTEKYCEDCLHAAGAPDLAAYGNKLHLIWQDGRFPHGNPYEKSNPNSEIFCKYSLNKGNSWSEDIRLTDARNVSYIPKIALNGNYLHVAWTDRRTGDHDVFYKRYPDFSLNPEPAGPFNLNARLSADLKDVVITWNLSVDDPFVGLGDNDVAGYEVYYSTSYESSRSSYMLLDTVTAGQNTYVHQNGGNGDPNSYFYYVAAVDAEGWSNRSVELVAKYTRLLSAGTNLISIPLVLNDNSIDTVLESLSYESAWYYEPSDLSNPWRSYNPAKPYNDLTAVDSAMGIFVKVTQDSYFIVAGKVPSEVNINMTEGWNLVGYPSFISRIVGSALSGIGYERIEGYDNAPPHYLKVFDDTDLMKTGYGYWIRATSDFTWSISN